MKPLAILALVLFAASTSSAHADLTLGAIYDATCDGEACTIGVERPSTFFGRSVRFKKGPCEFTGKVDETDGIYEGTVVPGAGSVPVGLDPSIEVGQAENGDITLTTGYEGCDERGLDHAYRKGGTFVLRPGTPPTE
ncbi:hypothetical protein [Aureimonas sp. N4]|uniref:hypothetical protein n=1 Tax=Aureimonas sp. N4 TaxID=1638165 RepID=UPI0007822B87|nr:hypothetical protein [Aureimonas sp. N4]